MARKILLADDSVTAQNMGRKILADAGYDVITVNNGSAALKRIAEAAPDLIILDVYMPGYSGLEVCQRLKDAAETADIPVLLSVGKLEPFKPQEARRVRADAHIVKPFEASQLLTAIARLEDAMVPQQHKSSHRFASSYATDDQFATGERILGRASKSGLRRKEASQADATENRPSSQAQSFRDFRKSKAQAAAASSTDLSPATAASSAAQEPAPPPELPRDITPEELSALNEVAAKLNEVAPAQSTTAQSATASAVATESAHEPTPAPSAEAVVSSAAVSAPAEEFVATPFPGEHVPEVYAPDAHEPEACAPEAAEAVDLPTPAHEPAEISAAAKNEFEVPVAQVEPSCEASVAAEAVPVESAPVEFQPVESSRDSEVPFPEPVSVASFPDGPAAVDQQDEPMFAAPAEEVAQEVMEAAPSETAIPSADFAKTGEAVAHAEEIQKEEFTSIDSSFAQPAFSEPASSESNAAEFCAVEGPTSEAIRTNEVAVTAPATEEAVEPEAPMPSAEELAEALRLLTPAVPVSESASLSPETVSAVSDWSNQETLELPVGKRWVAEALQLTPEEASMSLEAEMFRAFAANAEKIESLPVENPLLAIQTAVEKRIAEEIAKEPSGEVAPKAMAAAAPTGHGSAAHDEIEIASIVDKVMADLRPKIVEEIARKLAGK